MFEDWVEFFELIFYDWQYVHINDKSSVLKYCRRRSLAMAVVEVWLRFNFMTKSWVAGSSNSAD